MKRSSQQVRAIPVNGEPSRMTQAILDFVSQVPNSHIGNSPDPATTAQHLSKRAAQRAALTAGSLALPPGPLGWLTLLPELIAIWKIQGQLVSDIAAAYGRHVTLSREQMLWCLFRHTAAQAFRDLVVRMGDRLIFRRMSYGIAHSVARQIGVKLSQRTVGKGVARWLPVVGALSVGAYAYYDTTQVANTAIEMFESEVAIDEDEGENEDEDESNAQQPAATSARKPRPASKPTSRASAAGQAVRTKVNQTVAGAVHKVAGAARKRVARKPTPRKPHTPDTE